MSQAGGGNLLPERDGGSQQSSPASSTTSLSRSVEDLQVDSLETCDSPVCLSHQPDQLALACGAAPASTPRSAAPPQDAGPEETQRLAPATTENSPCSERVSASSSEPDPVCTARNSAVDMSDAFDEAGQSTARTCARHGATGCCSVARAASDPLAFARRGPSLSQRGNPAAPASQTSADTSSCHPDAPPALSERDAASEADSDDSDFENFESEASSAPEASPPNAASAPAPPNIPQEANADDGGGVKEPQEVVAVSAAAATTKPAPNPAIVLALPAAAVGNADAADPQGAVQALESSALQLLSPSKLVTAHQASGGDSDSRQQPKTRAPSPAAADALAAAAGANLQQKIRVNQAHQKVQPNLTRLLADQSERQELDTPSPPEVDDQPPITEQNRAISTLTIGEQAAIRRERGGGADGDAVRVSAGRLGSRQRTQNDPTAAANECGNVGGVGGGGSEVRRRRFKALRRLLGRCIGGN